MTDEQRAALTLLCTFTGRPSGDFEHLGGLQFAAYSDAQTVFFEVVTTAHGFSVDVTFSEVN